MIILHLQLLTVDIYSSKGPLSSFKHGKQDVSTAKKETECGIAFEKFSDVREGDWIQCVQVTYEKPSLNWIK